MNIDMKQTWLMLERIFMMFGWRLALVKLLLCKLVSSVCLIVETLCSMSEVHEVEMISVMSLHQLFEIDS